MIERSQKEMAHDAKSEQLPPLLSDFSALATRYLLYSVGGNSGEKLVACRHLSTLKKANDGSSLPLNWNEFTMASRLI